MNRVNLPGKYIKIICNPFYKMVSELEKDLTADIINSRNNKIIGVKEKDIYYIYNYVFSEEYLLKNTMMTFVQVFPKNFPQELKIKIYETAMNQYIQEEIFITEITEQIFMHTINYDWTDEIERFYDTDELFEDLDELRDNLDSD